MTTNQTTLDNLTPSSSTSSSLSNSSSTSSTSSSTSISSSLQLPHNNNSSSSLLSKSASLENVLKTAAHPPVTINESAETSIYIIYTGGTIGMKKKENGSLGVEPGKSVCYI